jgi:hypothetical protein
MSEQNEETTRTYTCGICGVKGHNMATCPERKEAKTVTYEDARIPLERGSHGWKRNCTVCGEDCSTTALVEIFYTFTVCQCDKAPYDHLVETLSHRKCVTGATR